MDVVVITLLIPVVIIGIIIAAFKKNEKNTGEEVDWMTIVLGSIPIILFFVALASFFAFGLDTDRVRYPNSPSIHDYYNK